MKTMNHTCVELFSGAGGLALGAEKAGFGHLLLNEFDADACATLRRNRPDWKVIEEDITKLSFSERPDVVFGGPPCQAFSMAGKRQAAGDIRGTMVFEFIRTVKEMQPKVAVIENVEGLLYGPSEEVYQQILQEFRDIGWRPYHRLLNAVEFGVPQTRKRLFFIAVPESSQLPVLFPKGVSNRRTLRDALEGCPPSAGMNYPSKRKKLMDKVPPGGNWRDLPPEDRDKIHMNMAGGGICGLAKRLSWDEPCPTLLCTPIQNYTERCHPDETRPLTVREYARIQTFPDDWVFEGNLPSQYKQIGNAVPVKLGFWVATAVAAMLDGVDNPVHFERADQLDFW